MTIYDDAVLPLTPEGLKDMIRSVLIEYIHGPGGIPEEVNETYEERTDNIGLLAVADYSQLVSDIISLIDFELESNGYEMNVSYAYTLICRIIDFAIEAGVIDYDDWEDVYNLFESRADEFASITTWPLGVVPDDITKWSGIIDFATRSLALNYRVYKKDGFTSDEKVMTIRTLLHVLRNRGLVDRNAPWVSELFQSLDEDWKVLGGGFGNNMGTGTNPWSGGR